MGFTRITASLVGVASILAVVAIATPQGYQPFRPYDPTGTSASNNNIDTTGNSDGASSTNSGGIFGNDDTGLDNGVDDNNGTPFGVDTNRGGSGSTDPTPDPDPAPTCAGALRCCDNPFSGLYSADSPEAQEALFFYGLPSNSPGRVAVGCDAISIGDAANCPCPQCCTGPQSGAVVTGCANFVIN
ncbi:hypothetical protein BXZ70DRAFT_949425 [Cristinia sonorae]|uniref:Hydrophobin n=1 Tax=Cristinia sonorae TaxID=1940300 RepID=A0A8K0UIF3_9AGAR|nr:hypothetical protein BXZ70DRAFT_949425 [Cristinia sonorae]